MTTTYPARQAEPGQAFTWNGTSGAVEAQADEHGVLQPTTPDEVRLADAFGLPLVTTKPTSRKAAAVPEPTDSAPADPAKED